MAKRCIKKIMFYVWRFTSNGTAMEKTTHASTTSNLVHESYNLLATRRAARKLRRLINQSAKQRTDAKS
jgi:hypothetical protein